MIWVVCELNGKGYIFSSCNSMEDAEYLNFELWQYRQQFGFYNSDEFETFLIINSYKSYKIRDGKISSFGNNDGKFTTFLFSQKKFNNFSDNYLKTLDKQQKIFLCEFIDLYEKKNVLFENEILSVTLGKIAGKRFTMYTSKFKENFKLINFITEKTKNDLIREASHSLN
jgi:hypothetical protein